MKINAPDRRLFNPEKQNHIYLFSGSNTLVQ